LESFVGKRAEGPKGKKSVFSSVISSSLVGSAHQSAPAATNPRIQADLPGHADRHYQEAHGERGPLALPALGAELQIARLPLLCRRDEVHRIDPRA
jgi:hypothetical protein